MTSRLIVAAESLRDLLEQGGEPAWAHTIRRTLDAYAAHLELHTEKELARDLKGLFGGMGSMTDVVLYDQSGLVDRSGTDELERRRRALFETIVAVLTAR